MPRAKNLQEAYKLLDPRPLDFLGFQPTSKDAAKDPAFYIPPPEAHDGGAPLPGPVELIRQSLLAGGRETKLFLSGHVGSGKSTELSRLAADARIRKQFEVVSFRIEEHEWATIDSTQLLFRLAGELFERYKDALGKQARWQKVLKSLNDRLYEKVGMRAEGGTTGVEFSLFIVKLRTELKFSDKVRKQFREFGETSQSILQDFIKALVDDIENHLAEVGAPDELVVLVDDLDKVRGAEEQKELFENNLNALLAPPMRTVYTLPTGVAFAGNRPDVRANTHHLYPIRILKKAPKDFQPEDAYDDERSGFFRTLIEHRIEEGIIDPEAVRLSAIYSGGVLRDFFRLLRDAILIAEYRQAEVLDATLLRYAVKNAQRAEAMGLYSPDYEALAHVHRTNQLRSPADRVYLDQARVLECHNGSPWFEVSPLLWSSLRDRVPDGSSG